MRVRNGKMFLKVDGLYLVDCGWLKAGGHDLFDLLAIEVAHP